MFILKYSRSILQCFPSLCTPVQLCAVDQVKILLWLSTLPWMWFFLSIFWLMPAVGQGGGRTGVKCRSWWHFEVWFYLLGSVRPSRTHVHHVYLCTWNVHVFYKLQNWSIWGGALHWGLKWQVWDALCLGYFLLEFRCCMLRLKIDIFLLALYILLMDAWYNL